MSTMTPYAAAKIVNETLKNNNIAKAIPPQMMYTYAKKNYIATEIVDGKTKITSEGLQKWLKGYLNKILGVTEKSDSNIDANQLELFSE